jgi:hypothetical protein
MEKFGQIKKIMLPRPSNSKSESAIGKVSLIGKPFQAFIDYKEFKSAFAAYNMLHGKKFKGVPIEINFYDQASFDAGNLQ